MIEVKDNTRVSQEKLSAISNLISFVANKTLNQLESQGVFIFPNSISNTEDLNAEQMIVQSINKEYCFSNVMGWIGYESENIFINSRFSDKKSYYFLQYLIDKVMGIPNLIDCGGRFDSEEEILNILIYLFPYYLKQAMKRGYFKQYVTYHHNDIHVKGSIDIHQHIKENVPFLGNIAYQHREFSYDNDVMQLIRHTIEYIRQKEYGKLVLKDVAQEVRDVIGVTPSYQCQDRMKIIRKNQRRPIKHVYYREYQSLQSLCLQILQHKKHQLKNNHKKIHGMIFDGAWLWEEYMNTLVNEQFYHPKNKAREGVQYLFTSSRKMGSVYPDFISQSHHPRMIADAKYKPKRNVQGTDYLQLLAYMFRFDAKRGYYFYPTNQKDETEILYLNQGSTYEHNVNARRDIMITKYGFYVPYEAQSYEEFVKEIQVSEHKLQEMLKE